MSVNGNITDVAVVGVGRMGRHHARTYHKLAKANLVAVVDADEEQRETIADEFGCDACGSVDELIDRYPHVRAVSVAVPTAHHLSVAAVLLERGIACLVEKPLAASVDEAQQLADLAARHGGVLQVGHTERFNPAVRAVAALGLTPRFIEVNRISPMTFRSLDVGVVMDMMIHDLDIVLTLAGSSPTKVNAIGVAVLGAHEDVVNARLTFASGCVANITASRLALKTERRMRLISEDAYVSLDYQRRNGLIIRKSGNAASLDDVRQQIAAGKDLSDLDYSQLVQVEQLAMDEGDDDQLTLQAKSFLHAVQTGEGPTVDAQAGIAAIELASRVVDAAGQHHWQGLTGPRV